MAYLFGAKLKLNKKYRWERAAFTLLEMTTSIFLIVMITATFIANYRSNNKRTDLIMTAQKLVADIHAAQNNTLGLVKYGAEVPAGGWGIHFNLDSPTRYIMFADLDRPASNEPGQVWPADPGFMTYDSTTEGDVNKGARIVDLPRGIEIISLEVEGASLNTNLAFVTFLPPDPKTNIYNGISTSTALRVTLKQGSDQKTKTVRVNFLGLVEVID
jgi:hypothetical protein